MGYYVTLKGQIDKDTVVLNDEKLNELKQKYSWIEFDEGSFEYYGNWSDGIINFLKELPSVIKSGGIIVDCDGELPRDIGQYKISPQGIQQRNLKRLVFEKWKPAAL